MVSCVSGEPRNKPSTSHETPRHSTCGGMLRESVARAAVVDELGPSTRRRQRMWARNGGWGWATDLCRDCVTPTNAVDTLRFARGYDFQRTSPGLGKARFLRMECRSHQRNLNQHASGRMEWLDENGTKLDFFWPGVGGVGRWALALFNERNR